MSRRLEHRGAAEFLGTALLIFFGTGCVAALKVGGASLGLCGFLAHDVCMAACKPGHGRIGGTPVLRAQLLRRQGGASGPGGHPLVHQRRWGCGAIGSTRKIKGRQRRALCQRQGRRQQGQAGKPASREKRNRGAHGDLRTTNQQGVALQPPARPAKGAGRQAADALWASEIRQWGV